MSLYSNILPCAYVYPFTSTPIPRDIHKVQQTFNEIVTRNRVHRARKYPQEFRYLSCIDLDFTVMIMKFTISIINLKYNTFSEFVQDQNKTVLIMQKKKASIIL